MSGTGGAAKWRDVVLLSIFLPTTTSVGETCSKITVMTETIIETCAVFKLI